MVYIKTSKIENLIAFAVVSDDVHKVNNLEVEKRFLTKPFKHFNNLDSEKDWFNKMIEDVSPKI